MISGYPFKSDRLSKSCHRSCNATRSGLSTVLRSTQLRLVLMFSSFFCSFCDLRIDFQLVNCLIQAFLAFCFSVLFATGGMIFD